MEATNHLIYFRPAVRGDQELWGFCKNLWKLFTKLQCWTGIEDLSFAVEAASSFAFSRSLPLPLRATPICCTGRNLFWSSYRGLEEPYCHAHATSHIAHCTRTLTVAITSKHYIITK
jgi:hypothetical protein